MKKHVNFRWAHYVGFGCVVSVFCLGLALYFINRNHAYFDTFEKIQNYSQRVEEFPEHDNTDLMSPDYTKFYKKYAPSAVSLLLYKCGILVAPEWNSSVFTDLLDQTIKKQEARGNLGQYVVRIAATPQTKIVLWGDLHGAFHSLVRVIEKIKELGIINDNLEIIKPNHFFVFNGNVVNRSPYILETLTLVLRLMEKNPDKVFYIRGNHESEDNFEFGLRHELLHKIGDESIIKRLIKFFNTLPLAAYITSGDGPKQQIVRIFHQMYEEGALKQEPQLGPLLQKKSDRSVQKINIISSIDLPHSPEANLRVDATIKGVPLSKGHMQTTGLSLTTEHERGVSWTMLSSPTKTYKTLYDFYFDICAIITVMQTPRPWMITTLRQDVRSKRGFLVEQLDLFSGDKYVVRDGKISPKSTDLVVGSILDLSGGIQEVCKSALAGIEMSFKDVNHANGISGKKLIYNYYDYRYIPHLAIQYVKELMEKKNIKIFLMPVGTSSVNALLHVLTDKQACVLFPITGANSIRKSEHTNIVSLRTSYNNEAKEMVKYAVKKMFVQKIAIFYQDNDYGKDPLTGAIEELEALGVKKENYIAASYQTNTTEVLGAAQKIKDFNPDAIMLFSVPGATTSLFLQLGQSWVATKFMFGISPLNSRNFLKGSMAKGVRIIFSHVVPSSENDTLEIIRDFRNCAKKYNVEIDDYSLEGYIAASLFAEAVKKIGDPVTAERLVEFFTKMKQFNFKGLELTFDPDTRELTKNIWISSQDGVWEKVK